MYKGLEKSIESEVTDYAEQLGCMQLKLNVIGQIGWPDRMYLYRAKVMFIEFKREGESPKKIQLWVHGKLRNQGFRVELIDNVVNGKRVIDEFLNRKYSLE